MKICPKCGGVASYNSYFGAYLCDKCDWREDVSNTIDLISRQEAIDEIKRLILQDEDGEWDTPINDTLHDVIGILEDLPSTRRCNNRDLIERETIREIIYHNQEPLNEYQLNKIPAVDANADFVRCKDCDMWNDDGSVHAHSCAEWSNPEDGYTRFTEPNDFCSYAWRKTNE